MKLVKFLLIGIFTAVVIVGGYVLVNHRGQQSRNEHAHQDIYYCPMHPHYTSDRPGNCPICQMKLVKKQGASANVSVSLQTEKEQKKILYWTDPMIPGYKAAGPGKSPMGMDLIPVYEQEKTSNRQDGVSPEGYAPVTMNTNQQQLIGVKTVEVIKRPLVKIIRAPGVVAHGMDLYEVQNEYIDAYVQFITTYRDYKRFTLTRRTWETHRDVQIKMLEAEHKLLMLGLNHHQLALLRQIDREQIWNQPELMFFKSDKKYWIFAQLFEDDLGYVEAGQTVQVELLAYREKFEGVIRSVGGAVDPESRTVRVLIEPKNDQDELVIGMLANVSISAELGEQLAVPREAVMDLGTRKVVFVAKSDGLFEPKEVEIGAQADDYWAVTKGLTSGERVVIDGNFLLDSESRLQASIESSAQSSQQGGQPHDN